MRLLGVDYGRKRIGLALSDPLGYSAQPIGSVPRDGKEIERLRKIVQEHGVAEVVLGYPRSLSGEAGPMAREVETFGRRLEAELGKPLHYWDERFTTSEAENLLISADVRRSQRKEKRDTVAASLILQGFMESRRGAPG